MIISAKIRITHKEETIVVDITDQLKQLIEKDRPEIEVSFTSNYDIDRWCKEATLTVDDFESTKIMNFGKMEIIRKAEQPREPGNYGPTAELCPHGFTYGSAGAYCSCKRARSK